MSDWVAAYERAWRAPGTGALAGIFTQDATYRQSPYEERGAMNDPLIAPSDAR